MANVLVRPLILLACTSATFAQPLNTELLVNGGAETGDATGWVDGGIEAAPISTAPGGFGDYVFAAREGPSDFQSISQDVLLSTLVEAVDAGDLVADFSIYIESRESDVGYATISFLDQLGATIDENSFSDPASEVYDWQRYGIARTVPPGTRTIRVLLWAARDFGISTDAFFDDASLQLQTCSRADFSTPFGVLDFFDVQAFLNLFAAGDPQSDLNSDGALDFFDLQQFLQLFSQGCA